MLHAPIRTPFIIVGDKTQLIGFVGQLGVAKFLSVHVINNLNEMSAVIESHGYKKFVILLTPSSTLNLDEIQGYLQINSPSKCYLFHKLHVHNFKFIKPTINTLIGLHAKIKGWNERAETKIPKKACLLRKLLSHGLFQGFIITVFGASFAYCLENPELLEKLLGGFSIHQIDDGSAYIYRQAPDSRPLNGFPMK